MTYSEVLWFAHTLRKSATLEWSRGGGRAPVLRSPGNLSVESREGLEVAYESTGRKDLVSDAECRVLE